MKRKIVLGINLVLCILCLVISCQLFYNLGIFVDEYSLSPDVVNGGAFWLLMDWLRLGLLAIIVILTFFMLIFDEKKD